MTGNNSIRLIAFYLPQFHPIPENDEWWGKGFTEWTNVVQSRPRFEGHYQPHLPSELGFYDLRVPEVREAQALLAQTYGVHGFCYYHYWFHGKRLLNRVFDEVLDSGKPDLGFCLCWANESWRRNWQGKHKEALIEQTYSHDDDLTHFRWLARAFRDSRYIRVGDKPLFLVYRTQDLPNARRTVEIWREESHRMGIGDLYLCCVESDGFTGDPAAIGFDAVVEFPPHQNSAKRLQPPTAENRNTEVFAYDDVANASIAKYGSEYIRHPCVVPAWDNSARRHQLTALVIQDSTPEKYEAWLGKAVAYVQQKPQDEQLVFVNAWNEWAEGAHLEPDMRFRRGYLEATSRALGISSNSTHFPETESSPLILRPLENEFDAESYYTNESLAQALDDAQLWKQKYLELEAYARRLMNEQKSIRFLSRRLIKESGVRLLPQVFKR